MKAVDRTNWRYGRHTIRPLLIDFTNDWKMKQQKVGPRYMTHLNEALKAQA
jgi:hypothetical protein